ncbi:MAG: pcnB [Gammaproteobacteria bacterium]|nr:pcnB [Gammaproteobacteria bacterium]
MIIPRAEHNISRKDITPTALKVLYRLQEAGFDAYLVGGGVRDLLLGLHPKDFDVATNAHPEQVRKIFSNSRLIGRRFRIVHVFFGRDIVEVTTFRKGLLDEEHADHQQSEHGVMLRDNVFGTIEEDAVRRDFTVNALYYNIADFSVVDFTNGMQDLKHRIVRLIGEPEVRFREDPVRMLRAVRFAAKLGFELDPAISQAIPKMHALLDHISKARLFDEWVKILMSCHACKAFELLLQHGLLEDLLPSIPKLWHHSANAEALAKAALENTDERLKTGKSINPAFMLAVLYWPIFLEYQKKFEQKGMHKSIAFEHAISEAIQTALKDMSIPRRFTTNMREIWGLQRRFNAHPNKRLLDIPLLPRFRAGYDFLLLRASLDPSLKPLAEWWTAFYEATPEMRHGLLKTKPKKT